MKKNKPSLVITKYESDGEKHNNSHNNTASWKNESDEKDYLYELIRGVPAVIVSNRNSQSNKDFIPKRNLIGRKILKIGKIGKNSFLVKKTFFGGRGKSTFFVSGGGKQHLKCLCTAL